jgi:carbon-monoxide dehydrogenase large subunit
VSDAHGRDHLTTAKLGLDANGRFVTFQVDTTANLGAYLSTFARTGHGPGRTAPAQLTACVPHNFPHDKLEPGLNKNAFCDPSNFTDPADTCICVVVVDPQTGVVRVDRFTACDDFGHFTVETVKGTPCAHNPLGVKGCGEAGAIGSPPALINAVCHALGVKDVPMPASPHNVWKAVQAAK